jgi:hypothetical protein
MPTRQAAHLAGARGSTAARRAQPSASHARCAPPRPCPPPATCGKRAAALPVETRPRIFSRCVWERPSAPPLPAAQGLPGVPLSPFRLRAVGSQTSVGLHDCQHQQPRTDCPAHHGCSRLQCPGAVRANARVMNRSARLCTATSHATPLAGRRPCCFPPSRTVRPSFMLCMAWCTTPRIPG